MTQQRALTPLHLLLRFFFFLFITTLSFSDPAYLRASQIFFFSLSLSVFHLFSVVEFFFFFLTDSIHYSLCFFIFLFFLCLYITHKQTPVSELRTSFVDTPSCLATVTPTIQISRRTRATCSATAPACVRAGSIARGAAAMR